MFYLLFFLSGFSALLYQITWQRILVLYSGVDVFSVTIIVSAFMAGLGFGSYVGGRIADRKRSIELLIYFAIAEVVIALFGYSSKWLFYDVLYLRYGAVSESGLVQAATLFSCLLIPTFLMGVTLPLLSKCLTKHISSAGEIITKLYSLNTLGSGVGSLVLVWILFRNFDLPTCLNLAASINLFCGLSAILYSVYLKAFTQPHILEHTNSVPNAASFKISKIGSFNSWMFFFFLSGFIALSLEILWFRALNILQRGTSFTFGTLLGVYLISLALGSYIGIPITKKSNKPGLVFLLCQSLAVVYAPLSFILFFYAVANIPLFAGLSKYFEISHQINPPLAVEQLQNYLFRGELPTKDLQDHLYRFVWLYIIAPIYFISIPAILIGISYPALQRQTQDDFSQLGKRVGLLQCANIIGTVVGSLLMGFCLLKYLGFSNSLVLISILGCLYPIYLLYYSLRISRSFKIGVIATSILVCLTSLSYFFPDSQTLWAKLHGVQSEEIIYGEDSSGLAVLIFGDPNVSVTLNGRGQSWIPFGGIHSALGVVPSFLHPNPKEVALIGFGSGDTAFSIGGRESIDLIRVFEVVAPMSKLSLSERIQTIYPGAKKLAEDKRLNVVSDDGRSALMRGLRKYDIIEADAIEPTSAYSANLYSIEYFRLIQKNLNSSGLAVTWVPSGRVRNAVLQVFPYVLFLDGIAIGSNSPIVIDEHLLKEKVNSEFSKAYFDKTGITPLSFFEPLFAGRYEYLTPESNRNHLTDVNYDLFPKDEFGF